MPTLRRRVIGAVIACALLLSFVGVSTYGQGKGKGKGEKHAHIHKAIKDLKHTKSQLEKAAHDYDGHRVEAIKHVDHAIDHLHKALKSVGK